MKSHVCPDFVEPERPWSPQAQYVVDSAHRPLTHGFLEHPDSDCPDLRPLEYPTIDLRNLGQKFVSTPEIGAATGIAFLPGGTVQAAAEPTRRGGGSALVQFGE